MLLKDLKTGEHARVVTVGGEGALRQHFLDMGVLPDAELTVVKFAPMGDPMEIRIHGYELTLRLADAARIEVEQVAATSNRITAQSRQNLEHPALGEPGVHHEKENENPLPDNHLHTFALVGNQNSGKTTLFNRLTGGNQHVGNFPGTTMERKDGAIVGYSNTRITDLPGVYSLSPYTSEEAISRDFLLQEKPDAIINVVDATNLERNLYLTMQLLEMNIPMVIALNMMDELVGNGGAVYVNAMESMLGVPVVPISALKNQGLDELLTHAMHVAHYQEKPLVQDFCPVDEDGGAVHRSMHAVMHLIEDHAEKADIPKRFAACKALEGDQTVLHLLQLDSNETELLEHILVQLERERKLDTAAAMADMRFDFIERVSEGCVVKPEETREYSRTQKMDRILTGKWTAIPTFVVIMATVFYLTFNVIGATLEGWMQAGIDALSVIVEEGLVSGNANPVLQDLIINGIFNGVGSVLTRLPVVVTMFFFLSMLEDSGYIARIAFFMDKLFRKLGLSGRSIVPLLIGFGCSVPAILATRSLPSERDRKMTILLTPFMSCTAKLPIYAFFVAAFFPGKGGLVMTAMYLLGIVVAVLVAFLYKRTLFRGEPIPFVMELPNYRLPSMQSTLQLMWEKAKDFLQKAFSVILLATIAVWFLQSFDFHLNLVSDSSNSIMAHVAGFMEPLFAPLGLGDWRIITALISGFMAKESVVAVLEVMFGVQGGIQAVLSIASAVSLLVFTVIYTPCVAAIASVKQELGLRWAFIMAIWQCIVAWVVALVFFLGVGVIL